MSLLPLGEYTLDRRLFKHDEESASFTLPGPGGPYACVVAREGGYAVQVHGPMRIGRSGFLYPDEVLTHQVRACAADALFEVLGQAWLGQRVLR